MDIFFVKGGGGLDSAEMGAVVGIFVFEEVG